MDTAETPRVQLSLRILGERVAIDVPQPPDLARVDELLPLLCAIDDAAITQAERREVAAGRTITCCRGCSACCRAQPVPVTPPEAYALLRLVEALPEPRQAEVRAQFTANVQALADAGLVDAYLNRDESLSAEAAREIAKRYFGLGLVCPFLRDDACSIYTDRPFVCRQYLVTSPAILCSDPFQNPVVPIGVPLAPATAMLAVTSDRLGRPQFTIPLALALEYATRHRDELERVYSAQALAQQLLNQMLAGESTA